MSEITQNQKDWCKFLDWTVSVTGPNTARLVGVIDSRLKKLVIEQAAIGRHPESLRESAGNLHSTVSAEAAQAKNHLVLARNQIIEAIQLIHKLNMSSVTKGCLAVHTPEGKGARDE